MGKLGPDALADLIPEGARALCPSARAALAALADAAQSAPVVDADLISDYVERVTQAAALRDRRRRSAQQAEDHRRTVSARVPEIVAARYQAAADAAGLSLYGWVRATLDAAARGGDAHDR